MISHLRCGDLSNFDKDLFSISKDYWNLSLTQRWMTLFLAFKGSFELHDCMLWSRFNKNLPICTQLFYNHSDGIHILFFFFKKKEKKKKKKTSSTGNPFWIILSIDDAVLINAEKIASDKSYSSNQKWQRHRPICIQLSHNHSDGMHVLFENKIQDSWCILACLFHCSANFNNHLKKTTS